MLRLSGTYIRHVALRNGCSYGLCDDRFPHAWSLKLWRRSDGYFPNNTFILDTCMSSNAATAITNCIYTAIKLSKEDIGGGITRSK